MSIIYRVRERDNVRRVRVHTVGSQLPGGVGSVGGEIYGQKKTTAREHTRERRGRDDDDDTIDRRALASPSSRETGAGRPAGCAGPS